MTSLILRNRTVQQSSLNTEMLYLYPGLILFTLYLTQGVIGFEWELMAQLQQNTIYKQVSGFAFFAVLLWQWRLYRHRSLQLGGSVRDILYSHRFYGAISPLVLFAHSMTFGYALQTILLFSYLLTVITGLLSPHAVKVRHKAYMQSWLVVHVVAATLMMCLCGYHIYVVYWYS